MHTFDLNTASQKKQLNYNVFNFLMERWDFKRQSSSEHNFVEPCGGLVEGITQPHLGLTIPPHEFVIAIRTWLGISIFSLPPSSVLCCCGGTIDPFGDHLISCHRGPQRVQRHKALCEIIFQALLVENN